MIANIIFSIIYKSFIVIFAATGLAIGMGATRGGAHFQELAYFTYLSNLFVLIYFIINIIYSLAYLKNHSYKNIINVFPKVKGAMTMCISITFLVYHFLLSSNNFAMSEPYHGYNIANSLVHYIVPMMSMIDFIIFDKKGVYKKSDPLIWFLIPLVYFIFSIIRGALGKPFSDGSRYPYFFIDIDKYGMAQIALNLILLALAFLLMGYLIYFIDSKFLKLINRSKSQI